MENPPKKLGRPSTYSPEVAGAILERIASGESLRKICQDDGLPTQTTIYAWLLRDEDFAKQYARARADQAEVYADEITAIADEPTGDVQRDKLRIDARKWIASKLLPKKYGEKLQAEHSGPDGGPIPFATVERRIVDAKGEQ